MRILYLYEILINVIHLIIKVYPKMAHFPIFNIHPIKKSHIPKTTNLTTISPFSLFIVYLYLPYNNFPIYFYLPNTKIYKYEMTNLRINMIGCFITVTDKI